jgi:hypothetical protein
MKSLESTGLTLERTGVGTDRELHTIRHKSNYVASICYNSTTDRFEVKKAGVWVDVCLRPELTLSQHVAIETYFEHERRRFHKKMFNSQSFSYLA